MRPRQVPAPVFAALMILVLAAYSHRLSQSVNPSQSAAADDTPQALSPAPVKPVIDDYYGTKVEDPYRYMEDLGNPDVQSWMKAQDDYARATLAAIAGRERMLKRIQALDQSVAQVRGWRVPGDLYFVQKILPGENTMKLYVRSGLRGQDKLLVDPEKVGLAAEDQGKGTNVINGFVPSSNGRYLALNVVPGGDELHGELHVLEIGSARQTGDVITRIGAEAWQANWLPNDRGFVYGRVQKLPPGAPAAEVRQKFRAYLHELGTNPDEDQPVFGYGVVPSIDVDPSLIASVQIRPGSSWALGVLNGSVTPNSAYYIKPAADLLNNRSSWRKVADFSDGVTDVVPHNNDLYLLTYTNAPRYQVLRTDARNPDLAAAEVVVPASQAVISSISPAADALYVRLLDGGINRIIRVAYGPHPTAQAIDLPVKGSAFIDTDPRLPGALLYLTSWTQAFKIYAFDPRTKQSTDTHLQPSGPFDSPSNIESVEVKAQSYDGTLIPLSITYEKGMRRDGSNPTLLEGYGSYGYPFPPHFAPTSLAWFQSGGVHAICHVRGGGEYGEEWHLAGKGSSKPNTWKDFIACAQYLIENKYTSPSRLAGEGVSAGGILIGRTLTSRPDLFAAVIDKVGLSDTLRSEQTQNGETNIPEFGTVKTEEGFKALYEMSAYAHVQDGTAYPAVLLETGINDPRVDPWHMSKMAARLKAATTSGKPVLLRIDYAGGHGALGATREQEDEQLADEWSFLLWQFGTAEFQAKK
jgi:prolyl oligopeptidase